MSAVTLGSYTTENAPKPLPLAGSTDGSVHLGASSGASLGNAAGSTWTTWAYFPNTMQLRNEYVSNSQLGYPMCITAAKTTV